MLRFNTHLSGTRRVSSAQSIVRKSPWPAPPPPSAPLLPYTSWPASLHSHAFESAFSSSTLSTCKGRTAFLSNLYLVFTLTSCGTRFLLSSWRPASLLLPPAAAACSLHCYLSLQVFQKPPSMTTPLVNVLSEKELCQLRTLKTKFSAQRRFIFPRGTKDRE